MQLEVNEGKKKNEELESMLIEKEKLRKEQEERIAMLKNFILVSTQPVDNAKVFDSISSNMFLKIEFCWSDLYFQTEKIMIILEIKLTGDTSGSCFFVPCTHERFFLVFVP